MTKRLWYAVQETREDAWDNGTYDHDEAVQMLQKQGCGLIAVIDEEAGICVDEIEFDPTGYYYWIDMCSTEAFTMYRGKLDEDGEKDRDTEEEILSCRYSDIDVNPLTDNDDERDANWQKIDTYIKSQLGFLPDYEVN